MLLVLTQLSGQAAPAVKENRWGGRLTGSQPDGRVPVGLAEEVEAFLRRGHGAGLEEF